MDGLKESLCKYMYEHPQDTVADAIYHTLRDAITTFKLCPGTNLKLVPLADLFDVSITPIREAFRRLESDYLLVIGQDKRACISLFQEDKFRELQDYRMMMETLGAELACIHASESIIDNLHRCIVDNNNIYEMVKVDISKYPELISKEMFFHKCLVEASANSILIKRYNDIYPTLVFYRQFFSPLNYDPIEYPKVYKLIDEALKVRDREIMRKVMKLHFSAINHASRLS